MRALPPLATSSLSRHYSPNTFKPNGSPLAPPQSPQHPTFIDSDFCLRLPIRPQISRSLLRRDPPHRPLRPHPLRLPNPLLNLVARFPEGGGHPVIEIALASDLLTLLQRPHSIKAADAHLRSSAADALSAILDSLAAVQTSYANLQAIEEELEILQRRRALVDQLVELSQARLKAGEAARLDVTTVQTHKLEADIDLEDLRSRQIDERLALTRLIGQPSGAAEWKISPWQPPSDLRSSEEIWIAAAKANRPELRAKAWELIAISAQRRGENLAWLQGGDIGVHAEHDQWSLGPAVTVPLPIFDTGHARIDKAIAQEIQARHELTQIQRQVIEDVRRAYAAYRSSAATLHRANDQLLPLQQQVYDQAKTAYRAGETDLLRLLTAEEDLQEAHRKIIDLRKRASLARIKLYRASGGPGVIPDESTSTTRPSTQP